MASQADETKVEKGTDTIVEGNFDEVTKEFDMVVNVTVPEKGIANSMLLFGRGTKDGKLYAFSERPIAEHVAKITTFFDLLFQKDETGMSILDRLADISRGDKSGSICFDGNGNIIWEQLLPLKNAAKFLTKSARFWYGFESRALETAKSTPQ